MARSTVCADTGNQSTLTFEKGITATLKFRSIDQPEQSIGKIDCSDNSTADEPSLIPEDLVDPIEIGAEYLWDTFDTPPALKTDLGVVTITYPLRPGETTPATRAGSGYVSGIKHPTLRNNELQVGMLKVQFDGVTAVVYTPST